MFIFTSIFKNEDVFFIYNLVHLFSRPLSARGSVISVTTLPLALSLTLTHNHLCGGGDDVSIPPSHSILCLSRACSRSYNLMDPLPCNWSHLRLLSIIFWMDILSRVVHERDGESRWWIWDWTFWFSWGAINYSNPNRWYSHYSIYAKWRKTWPVLSIHMT